MEPAFTAAEGERMDSANFETGMSAGPKRAGVP